MFEGERDAPAAPRLSPLELSRELELLRTEMRRRHEEYASVFERVRPSHRQSAANLIDYLTLRQYDLRDVQVSLAELGLSSLGRTEEHVITTLERVIDNLHVLTGNADRPRTESAVGYTQGREILEQNADSLLGPMRSGRSTRILVTMPSEAADDFVVVRELMERGMDCARINCAHDAPEQWGRMVDNIRRAEREFGRKCQVLMDLPGPKLRTGPIEAGPRVIRLRPRRDAWGRATVPAEALLVAEERVVSTPTSSVERTPAEIPVAREWLEGLQVNERITLSDTRDSSRVLTVLSVDDGVVRVGTSDTTYVATGTLLVRADRRTTTVGLLPARPQALVLRIGDVLTLTEDMSPAVSNEGATNVEAGSGSTDRTSNRLRIGCSMAEVFDIVRTGERVFFDDGKISGEIIATRSGEVDVRITAALPGGSKLRAEKGINIPDSDARFPAIGPDDDAILPLVVERADLVEISFAQSPSDVSTVQGRLRDLGGDHVGIVLKIETVRGFAALPDLLLTAMGSQRIGVMVARGDLAVECGFERLAEVQEEILWLCDAAHVPVIWATQVLDQMARTGQPSRAEISDAAMAGRAECVMLNKGPHIAEAVAALDDIISRMSSHQRKKMDLLRRLESWTLSSE